MRVLAVTNMFPTTAAPHAGVFVRREIEALRATAEAPEILVCHVDTIASTPAYLTGRTRVAQAVSEYDPDLVHVHYGLSLILTARVRRPTVCTFHGSDLNVPWQRAVSRVYGHRLAAAIFVSEALRRRGPQSAPAHVVPCGVPVELFRPMDRGAARALLGLPEDAVLLAFPSSPSRAVKRYDRFERVVAAVPSAVGVSLSGIEPGDMPMWLSAVDCVVLTSDAEGSPVITKEALCCGSRVVSTPVGDVAGQLHGFSGCGVAPSFDAGDVAAQVRHALSQTGPDAQEAARRFSTRAEAESVLRVYREVLGG